MRSVGLAIVIVLSLVSLSLASTAEFDMDYITSMTLPNDAEIVVSEARTYIGRKYCQGILKYKNRQEADGEYDEEGTDTEGWGWGYFAVEIGSNDDCDDVEGLEKPAFLYLHHYQPRAENGQCELVGGSRGSLGWARAWATQLKGIAVTISSPGQGFNCSAECSSGTGSEGYECYLGNNNSCTNAPDQISYPGDDERMSPEEMRDGFETTPVNEKFNLWYGYAHSGMRAITAIQTLFGTNGQCDQGEPCFENVTSGDVVVGGVSGGSVTSLIIHGVDERPKGFVPMFGMGGWEKSVSYPRGWLSALASFDSSNCTFDDAFDCDANPTGNALYACRMADWMDPVNYAEVLETNSPVFLIHGSQDEFFPIPSYKTTRDALINAGTTDYVFSFLISDMDHEKYMRPLWRESCSEDWYNGFTTNPANDTKGGDRLTNSVRAFFMKAISNDLDDFGDPTPATYIDVSGTLIKNYKTWFKPADTPSPNNARHAFSSTDFFHINPGIVNGQVSTGDIWVMEEQTTCDPGLLCYYHSAYYVYNQQPPYHGSFGQANYSEASYSFGGSTFDLYWHLTGDVVSAGTSGDTALTFTPEIRCLVYDGSCDCEAPTCDEACDDSPVFPYPWIDGEKIADELLAAITPDS